MKNLIFASVLVLVFAASSRAAVVISEVAPWSSGNSSFAGDWFEVTNTGGAAVNVGGWKMDDNSNSFASSVALNGITSIAAGESVIYFETTGGDANAFKTLWFDGTPPVGLQIGSYGGSQVGLSTSGDAVNLYDGSGVLQANVSFGGSTLSAPFKSFDNAAGLNNTAISQLSAVGVSGAFAASGDANEIGSPGRIAAVPEPASLVGIALAGLVLVRRRA
jgi:hypothetical protein